MENNFARRKLGFRSFLHHSLIFKMNQYDSRYKLLTSSAAILLRKGAKINSADSKGNQALHVLFETFSKQYSKSKAIASLLLEANADP